MNDQKYAEIGSARSIERKFSFLRKQIEILENIAMRLNKLKGPQGILGSVLFMYIAAAAESTETLILLANNNNKMIETEGSKAIGSRLRDEYVIGRTIFLSLSNACFTCAQGQEAAKRALRHAMQKKYRDLKRKTKLGNLEMAVSADFMAALFQTDLEIRTAVIEFTGSKGQERRNWTPEQIVKQLEIVQAKYGRGVGRKLIIALALIYAPASEIAHGTIYGITWALGINVPRMIEPWKKLDNIRRFNRDMLLYAVGICCCAAIAVFAKEFSILSDLDKESSQVEENLDSCLREGYQIMRSRRQT